MLIEMYLALDKEPEALSMCCVACVALRVLCCVACVALRVLCCVRCCVWDEFWVECRTVPSEAIY